MVERAQRAGKFKKNNNEDLFSYRLVINIKA